MTAIKPLDTIATKWATNAGRSGAAYKTGIQNPRRSWSEATQAADENRKAGLAAADSVDAFRKGVAAKGDSGWSTDAQAKGPSRFTQGVALAKPAYTTGFSPFASIIGSLTLPPRGPKGSPENITRVSAIADALHKAKVT